MFCICSCGRPAVLLRGDHRFASNECKAKFARVGAKVESERLARATEFATGGQETAPRPAHELPQPTEDEMREIIEAREGGRIRSGKVFRGDLAFSNLDGRALADKLRSSLTQEVNTRLTSLARAR